jgi:hypothetical protein
MKRLTSLCVLVFLACFMAPLAQAQARLIAVPKYDQERILRSRQPVKNADRIVHDAILKSAAKQGWVVVVDTGSTLRLTLEVRTHKMVIDVRILGDSVAINYVDSVNMSYEKNWRDPRASAEFCATLPSACEMNDKDVIHPNYANWIARLLKQARSFAAQSARSR